MRGNLLMMAGVVALALFAAACGNDVGTGTEGEPRTVEVTALDELAFDPETIASVSVGPGETAETVVTFDEAGELLYACHIGGHYEGEMVGTITIT
jgi:uncharacterized cupredoxin-like copper-binding protein